MISWKEHMTIKALAAEGLSRCEIARVTGHARETVKKVLDGAHAMQISRASPGSLLDPYKDHVRERFERYQLSAVRLIDEIRPMGYTGSVVTLRRFLKDLRGPVERSKTVTLRYETPPGLQAQADWTECGRFEFAEGRKLTVYAFLMVLGYSRQMFVQFTTSMKMAELIACHQAAFAYFGGWPRKVLYDNMKQIRIRPGKLNEMFLDFANHHGFVVDTHRPYRPRTKGKVERPVDYLKDNFLAGRTFASLDDLNAQGRHWLEHVANVRLHGTTHERPVDRFTQEGLTPVTTMPAYRFNLPVGRIVSREAMVHYQGSRYSVPPAFAGRNVQVTSEGGALRIVAGAELIAEHRKAARSGQSIMARDHLAELWKLTHEQIAAPRLDERERWHLRLKDEVEAVPLSVYEQVAS